MAHDTSHAREHRLVGSSASMTQAFRNLQHAVTQSRESIFMTDQAGLITRVNPAFENLTGYSSLLAVGKDFSTLLADGPHSDDYRLLWGRILQHRAFSGAVTILTKAGERLEVDVIVTPVLDHRSQIASLVCSCVQAHSVGATVSSAEQLPISLPYSQEIAHTLNNLLMCTMAHADYTCEMLPLEHPLRSRLEDIKRNAHRAASLGRLLLADAVPPVAEDVPVKVRSHTGVADDDGQRLQRTSQVTPQHTGPVTLLIVENEAPIREAMVQFLSDSGYCVLAAGSAEEAIEKTRISDAAIDLVITDITLPNMTGQQLASTLAALRPDLKFLFVSGHSQSALLPRDVPGLNRSYLEKPFSLSSLGEKVSVLVPAGIQMAAAASV